MTNPVSMPRVEIIPGVTEGVDDVVLTKPSNINVGNPSGFPLKEDKFKFLNYKSASNSALNTELARYYLIMNKIMAGTATPADLNLLVELTGKIRDYVLTDEDYNLVVGALQTMQTYILKFLYTDITNKAKAMDGELNLVIGELNRFMSDLETLYSQSPSQYPIPDKSVLKPKLEQTVQDTLSYSDSTISIVVSNSKPVNPVGRSVIWFNTGTKIV